MESRCQYLLEQITAGQASVDELIEFQQIVSQSPELTDSVSSAFLDIVEDQQATARRLEQNIGASLYLLGIAVLFGFGIVEGLMEADKPLWSRVGLALFVSGSLVVLFSIIRQRMKTSKHDKYKEIVR